MKKQLITTGIVAAMLAISSTSHATIIFSDDFNRSGNLITAPTPLIGGAWSVYDNKTVSFGLDGSRVTTTYSGTSPATYDTNGDFDYAFANFTRPLGENETLMLQFQTAATGNLLSRGFAGVSLYEGESYYEKLFIGGSGFDYPDEWSWRVYSNDENGVFASAVTDEIQEAVITYEYNTGDYSFSVGGQTVSGTTTANMALDGIVIGAGFNNFFDDNFFDDITGAPNSDIALDMLTVTASVPEPSTIALLGVGSITTLIRRRRRIS